MNWFDLNFFCVSFIDFFLTHISEIVLFVVRCSTLLVPGGYNADTAKAWRQNYHTKVNTKSSKYPALYAWEKKGENALMQSL